MKTKILAIVSTMALIITTFVACNKNNDALTQENSNYVAISQNSSLTNSTILLITDSIGIYHNLCMAHLSSYFDSLKLVNWTTNEQDLLQIIEDKTIEFYANKNIVPSNYNIYFDESLDNLSPEAKQLLEVVDINVEKYFSGTISDQTLTIELKKVQNDAATLLKSNEAIIVGSAASVGYNSISFWTTSANNYDIYDNGFNDSLSTFASANQRAVGKADINGAVYGGIGGLAGGVPGAIVGASVGAAYKSFVKAFEVTKGWDLWWLP